MTPQFDHLRDLPAPLTGLLAITVLNWLLFFVVTAALGGTALGTSPINPGEFFVAQHLRRTIVSQPTWLFSLVYSVISLLLLPASIWAVTLFAFFGDRSLDRPLWIPGARLYRPILVLGSLFGLVWFYGVVRDLATSTVAWLAIR